MSRRSRWMVPAGVAVVLAAGMGIPAALANATPDLPDRSAEQLIADVAQAGPVALQGTVSWTANLGLPELPDMNNYSQASPTSLLYGTTTVDVWYDGNQSARAALKAATSQYTMVANPTEAWAYSSSDNTAVHVTGVPQHNDTAQLPPGVTMPTPQELAAKVVQLADPSTAMTVDKPVKVAGRDCYQLVLTPKDEGTLIGSVRIAIDAANSQPLRVQVWAAGASKPAIDSGFTSITYTTPDPALFNYQAPAGADVTTIDAAAMAAKAEASAGASAGASAPDAATHPEPQVSTSGSGWATVVDANLGSDAAGLAGDLPGMLAQMGAGAAGDSDTAGAASGLASIASQLTTQVPQGTAVSLTIGSALLTNDGHVLVGAVPVATLQAAAK